MLAEVGNGLVAGPNDSRYTSILMGVRGSGKTVALNEIEDRAAADGWVVLSMDAGTPGLLERIVRTVSQAGGTYEALNLGESADSRSVERSIGIRLGMLEGKIAATEYRDHRPNMGLREHLTRLVQAAQQHDTSVLLTVDELQGIDREEGRLLSNDLQHITRRAGMPLAFVGAGLLELKHTLMRDRKMTFFHRCEHFEMPPLTIADAVIGLAGTIRSGGGTITDEALRLASDAVNGSPYRLQVIGDIAWKTSDGPDGVIDGAAVKVAIDTAREVVSAKIGIPAWHDLSEGDQELLGAVAANGGTATSAEAARRSNMSEKAANGALRRLADLGYLDRKSRGFYSFADLVAMDVALAETGYSGVPNRSPLGQRTSRQRCRKWMPLAKAYCVQQKGHSGGCRSK